MIKKTFVSFFVFSLIFFNISAQYNVEHNVIASGGNYFVGPNGTSISYTIGEPVIQTLQGSDYDLTQGFQQPEEEPTYVSEIPGVDYGISVFPNPVRDKLTINIEKEMPGDANFGIYDMTGSLITSDKLNGFTQEVSFGMYKSGTYFLRIYVGSQHLQTFKIVNQ